MKEQQELLDSKKIIAAIAPENRGLLSGLEILLQVDSTNSYLLRQAKIINQSGWACLAEQQLKGRGRLEREWFSPLQTNIYCSLLWHFPANFSGISALSIACATIIVKALQAMGVENNITLKWPNDVLFSGRKLAGILLENIITADKNLMIIGIGLNLRLPEEKQKEWASVEEALAASISRNLAAGILLDNLLAGLELFQARGLKEFLPLYKKHDALYEKKISINTHHGSIKGTSYGLNEKGELIVIDVKGKEHSFCYGEVSVRM
jgi:BirA family transcriptional regulator, biotin operon repressor / biotin---[acetyl-CoA-carboxylase] ligase